MASYTNLASLSGLQVGDVIVYNTQMNIDLKKYKVRIVLKGVGNSTKKGGLTQLDLDGTKLLAQTLTYTPLYGTSLCYGSSADMYYRIAVAGNCGRPSSTSSGAGGGTSGAYGVSDSSTSFASSANGGGGGTQTSGGTGGSYGSGGYSGQTKQAGISGAFGQHPYATQYPNNIAYKYDMAGWYSGGTGAYCNYSSGTRSYTNVGGWGGGSGFVIGQSTTTYPSGYMGNNNTTINSIVSAISNATLTQGGSDAYYTSDANLPTTGQMIITILEVPKSFPKYYDGSAWVQTTVKRYNGSSWEDVSMKYYDGSSWQ